MTDATYIVFQDGFSGFKWIPSCSGNNLKEVEESIKEKCQSITTLHILHL